MTNKIDVVISGKVITIRSEESAEHVQRIARYVDQKIEALKAKNLSAVVDDRLRALLIALNMADDYFKVKDQYTAQELINKKLIVEASQLDRENIELKSQLQKLQSKLDRITQEFEDFLHNFDNPLQEKLSAEKPDNILHMPKTEARKAAQ